MSALTWADTCGWSDAEHAEAAAAGRKVYVVQQLVGPTWRSLSEHASLPAAFAAMPEDRHAGTAAATTRVRAAYLRAMEMQS